MLPPIIFIHEFFTGGGCQDAGIPPDLAAEGLAMLRGILADFRSWGQFTTLITVDERIPEVPLPADQVIRIRHNQHQDMVAGLIAESNAALIIAPENDGILFSLSVLVEKTGVLLLGSDSDGVMVAGDKWECYRYFIEAEVPIPQTWRVNSNRAAKIAEKAGFPLVVKPIDGAGCDGVGLATDLPSLDHAISADVFKEKDFLLQRYLEGRHYSVSMLVSGKASVPLSLNEQFLRIGPQFTYHGGCIVPGHSEFRRAIAAAKRAISLIHGLKGYVGVDMVLSKGKWYVIEINPRLTTSYVGLRSVININLAKALWLACTKKTLPRNVRLTERKSFSKEDFIGI